MAQLSAAIESGLIPRPVVAVLEGKFREGVLEGVIDGLTVLHAAGSGDDTLVDVARNASDQAITLVTADRELRRRAEMVGADVIGPGSFLELLEG